MSALKQLICYIGIILISGCSEETPSNIFVLFQKFSYSRPTNHFFITKFNLNNGKGEIVCRLNINDVILFQEKVFVENSYKNGFLLSSTNNTRYKLFYILDRNDYSTYVIDSHSNSILKKVFRRSSSHLTSHHFFYLGQLGKGLVEFNLLTRYEKQISPHIRAIAPTPLEIWEFYDNGKIKKSTESFGIEGKYSGLVTEAGFLAKHWIWFSRRKHEKAGGDIWIMNTLTGETHLARYWWSEKWGHSVAIMNLETQDLELIPCWAAEVHENCCTKACPDIN